MNIHELCAGYYLGMLNEAEQVQLQQALAEDPTAVEIFMAAGEMEHGLRRQGESLVNEQTQEATAESTSSQPLLVPESFLHRPLVFPGLAAAGLMAAAVLLSLNMSEPQQDSKAIEQPVQRLLSIQVKRAQSGPIATAVRGATTTLQATPMGLICQSDSSQQPVEFAFLDLE